MLNFEPSLTVGLLPRLREIYDQNGFVPLVCESEEAYIVSREGASTIDSC